MKQLRIERLLRKLAKANKRGARVIKRKLYSLGWKEQELPTITPEKPKPEAKPKKKKATKKTTEQ